MKNKNKKAILFLFVILLSAGFFGFQTNAETLDHLIISEILVGGEKADEEFVEIYNPTDSDIDLEKLPLKLHTVSASDADTNKTITFTKNIIPAGGYFVISSKEFREKFNDVVDAFYGSGVLTKGWSVYISRNKNRLTDVINTVKWKDCEQNYSYSFDGTDWKCTSLVTPGKENDFPKPKVYSDKIRLNELLPNPDGIDSKAEFIEFYNAGDTDESLDGWKIKTGGKEYTLKKSATDDLEIKAHNYLVINPDTYKLSLSNSKDTSLTLLSPDNIERSLANYTGDSVKENVSLSFDGTLWRWTRFVTKEKENKFSQPVKARVKKDNTVYAKMYSNFEATIENPDKSPLKFTWNFGDGHKSYQQKTRHKYEKIGAYAASLKIFDGSEDIIENFPVIVSNFPKQDIAITAVSPNPKGKDTKKEYVTLKNNTKQKINLKGWSIATGWKKMINHPIKKDFSIKPDKTKNLTGKFAAITLNNTKAKIELRDPTGAVVAKVKYSAKDGVQEDAIYEKTKKRWGWTNLPPEKNVAPPAPAVTVSQNTETKAAPVIENDIRASLGKYSEMQKQNFAYRSPGVILAIAPVQKINVMHPIQNQYFFTPYVPEKHWLVKFVEKINSYLADFVIFWL